MTKQKPHSKWGQVDHVTTVIDGLDIVSTPSHGGVILSPERQAEMHPALRLKSNEYEEDCEIALVVLNFAQHFKAEQVRECHKIAKDWFPHRYEKWSGVKLRTEESYTLRKEAAARENKANYVTMAAWGDWHKNVPKGMVGVFAGRGGRLPSGMYPDDCKYFLVPEDEYDSRGEFGFIIDLARHKECEPIH